MNYRAYQNTRDAVWKLLIDLEIRELPVQMKEICDALEIPIKVFTPTGDNDGFSMITESGPIIAVARQLSLERKRFTVAHELGHILLGHVGKYQLVNREPSAKDNPIEQAANAFASRLLAPACVLWGCDARTPEQIATLCSISHAAARLRADRMKLLYERNRFLSSSLEKRVYQQFAEFIERNNYSPSSSALGSPSRNA